MTAPLASRSGNTSVFGKRTESAKTMLAQSTKKALQERAMEASMTESEVLAVIVEAALHGPDHARRLQVERVDRALGIVPQQAHDNAGTGTKP